MDDPFRQALAAVNAKIAALLLQDPFPQAVTLPCLREATVAYPARGGKRLRPALLVWSCGLCGGKPDRAWQAALAVELYHNWTLVHDDIIDQDETRRGGPACHVLLRAAYPGRRAGAGARAKFGADLALLAGDIQHAWAVAALNASVTCGVPQAVTLTLVQRMCTWLTPALITGEAMDVEFAARSAVAPAEVETMMRLKTGALLRFAAESGAMIGLATGDRTSGTVQTLGDFAENAGLAFQLQDDVLGIFGAEASTGKPQGSDLREGKKTLLYVTGLARTHGRDRQFLRAVLGRPDLRAPDLRRAQALLRDCGAVAAVQQRAAELTTEARTALHSLPRNRFRSLLEAWLDYLCTRDR